MSCLHIHLLSYYLKTGAAEVSVTYSNNQQMYQVSWGRHSQEGVAKEIVVKNKMRCCKVIAGENTVEERSWGKGKLEARGDLQRLHKEANEALS